MAHFVKKGESVRVQSDQNEEEYIEIKAKLSQRDNDSIQGALMAAEANAETGEYTVGVDYGEYLSTFRRRSIVGWKLFDDDGETEIRFDVDLLDDWDPDDPLLDKAMEEVAQRNPSLGRPTREPSTPTE